MRFRLRTILIVVAIFGVALAGVAKVIIYHERRLQIYNELDSYSLIGVRGLFDSDIYKPNWFHRALLPVRYQKVVRTIGMYGNKSLDKGGREAGEPYAKWDCGLFAYFPEIQALEFYDEITESQILELPKLPHLRYLTFDNRASSMTPAAIKHMANRFPNLEVLVIQFVDTFLITDEFVDAVGEMSNLRILGLGNTQVTTMDTLLRFKQYTHIQEISIDDEPFSDLDWQELVKNVPAFGRKWTLFENPR